MSKRQFKSQASSGRAGTASGGFGTGFGTSQYSVLSYVQEPPDLSYIIDPNVIVSIKNLTKKDGMTKAKALEDLQVYVTLPEVDIEEGLLEAWATLFPRLSIDNYRRVRQLSHVLNGHVCAKCGKRTVRHMNRISGPWLAGIFDNDRIVSRAALDALNLVFPTAEKIQGVRKAFHRPILEYCRDAALHETAKTLSDERVVSSDDAEATYSRVVATSLSVVGSLLTELDPVLIEKEAELYEQIFSEPRLWHFVHNADAGVRRSIHRLVQTCLGKRPSVILDNLKLVSTAYIYKGLHSDQGGSALEFVQILNSLTSTFPIVWTDAYEGKKSALSRLRNFVKQGSQAASTAYWESLGDLFRKLPTQILPTMVDGVVEFLSSARAGVSSREERFNASAAWPAYFTLADVLTSTLDTADAESILGAHVSPVITQYLYPSPETADWSITGGRAAWIVSKVTMVKKGIPLLVKQWPLLADKLTETAKISQPEQSKDFEKSQIHVAATGERWVDLQRELWSGESDEVLADVFITSSTKILEACIGLLKSRNGKPYGAAAIIELQLRTCAEHLMNDNYFQSTYITFAENDMPGMMFSHSQRHLVHGLYAISSESKFSSIFNALLVGILDAVQPDEPKLNALRTMFPPNTPREAIQCAQESSKLQDYFLHNLFTADNGNPGDLFSKLVKHGALNSGTTEAILSTMMNKLTTSVEAEAMLSAIDVFNKTDQSVVQTFTTKPGGSGQQLLPNLLRLEQSPNDRVAEEASSLSSKISSTLSVAGSDAKYSVVLHNLEQTSETSLSIDAVLELANRLLGPNPKIDQASDVLPSSDLWISALEAVIRRPKRSMALMSPLGSAVHLLHNDIAHERPVKFDAEGLSQAFRISMYTTRLLMETDVLQQLDDTGATVLALLHVSILVAEDSISVLGTNDFWSIRIGREGEVAGLEFISEARKVLDKCWKSAGSELASDSLTKFSRIHQIAEKLRGNQDPYLPLSYYVSLSYVETLDNLFELHGFSTAQVKDCETNLKERWSKRGTLSLVEFLASFRQPLAGTQTINKCFNELISELTDLDIAEYEQEGLESLIVLNTILRTQEDITEGIAKQRFIFLAKQIITWLNLDVILAIKFEVCKALGEILPRIQDIYGEHWEQVVSFLVDHLKSNISDRDTTAIPDYDILLTNASLKLWSVLQKLSNFEEPNDDLVDALKDQAELIRDGLIDLLVSLEGVSDDTNQPLMVTNELLARTIASLPPKPLKQPEELYPLMYCPSRPLLQAAFDLLHKFIPSAQEQTSFDAAIDKKTARLPDELLSLILEAPTLDSLAHVYFDRMMPLQLQGYLYSWRLLFDFFNGSSYRVKNDYIEQLKDGTYLDGLLDFTFEFLGHTQGKPIDAAKFDILDYVPDSEPSPEKDVQWLLTHLYYLALTHLPSLVKSYYLGIRSRQTSATVESWTAKHISPLLIEASLRGVAEWAEKSVKEDPEYEKMTIKVGIKSKEVHVSYVVDEQTMAIKVVLPDAYPLASAQVLGVSRVAVKEEKWQSWLRNCQGVITFSNGSIIDGLTAWRKNVTGALKGQTECAICYSIISADKQLPTKRCPTCKNLFHSSCLLKWFKTSNASTCPLCRNPFNFN